jgi:hypothetical protein
MPRRSRPQSARGRRRYGIGPALGVLVAVVILSLPALALATITATGGTTATFRFSGELGGTLKAPKRWDLGYTLTQAGCEKTVDKTSFNIFFYNAKLALKGHKTSLDGGSKNVAVMLNVQVPRYGGTESFGNQSPGGAPDFPASVGFNAYAGHRFYSWETNAGSSAIRSSGTITTNGAGTGGSLSATLVPSGTGLPTGPGSQANGG